MIPVVKSKEGNSLCCNKCGQSFQTVSTQNVNNEHVTRCRSCGQYVPNGDSSSNISKAQSNKINFPPPPKKRDLLWNKAPMGDHDQNGNGNTHHIIPEIIVRNSNTDTSPEPDGTVHTVINMDLAVEGGSSLPNRTPKSVSTTYLSYTYYRLQTTFGIRQCFHRCLSVYGGEGSLFIRGFASGGLPRGSASGEGSASRGSGLHPVGGGLHPGRGGLGKTPELEKRVVHILLEYFLALEVYSHLQLKFAEFFNPKMD